MKFSVLMSSIALSMVSTSIDIALRFEGIDQGGIYRRRRGQYQDFISWQIQS